MKIYADQTIPLLDYYFAEHGKLHTFDPQTLQARDLRDADMLLVRSTVKVDEALLQEARQLKWLGSCVTGVDHLDEAYLRQRNIPYYAAQGCNAQAVAEYVLSVIAALQRESKLPLSGKAAVIGVGRIGNKVVTLLQKLGYSVATCDPLRAQEPGFVHTPLEAIADVDFIALHTPLTSTTREMINQAFLTRQKPGCVLLNAGRGEVIHESDLLAYAQHLTWCLDVFAHEPQINPDIVKHACIATPHIAGHTVEAKIRGTHRVYEAAAKQFGWAEKTMSVAMLEWQGENGSWQEQVLSYTDPRTDSKKLKQAVRLFVSLRKDYRRHEFLYVNGLKSLGISSIITTGD